MTDREILSVMDRTDTGDELEIECQGKRPRRIVVTAVLDNSLLVTSGRVRPGHFTGGRIKDYGEGLGVMYQATMQQPICRITSLNLIRKAAKRN